MNESRPLDSNTDGRSGQVDLAPKLPSPLAQLYRRAHNAKTVLERHLSSYYLWETSIKLLGAVAVIEYAELNEHDPQLTDRLKNLARPALGHWWEFVRRLVPMLAKNGDAHFEQLQGAFLAQAARSDLPRTASLDAALREVLDSGGGPRSTVRLSELLDRLVHFRNREVGHGAAGQRPREFYERMSGVLLAAASEVLGRFDILAGRRLMYVGEVRRQASGAWLVERYELIGESGRRLESLELPESATPQLPHPERLYLQCPPGAELAEGKSVLLRSLHPLLLYDADTNETLFLSARRGRQRTEYLSYTSGRFQERQDLGQEQRLLLARVLGYSVSDRDAEDFAGRSQAEEASTTPAATVPVGPQPTAPPRSIGEFDLLTEIGRGGMGVVYRAEQPSLGRTVALKCLLHPGDARAEVRFTREIRVLGSVEHPNLIKIFTSGAANNQLFYAMELVEGATLAAVCDKLTGAGSRTDIDRPSWVAVVRAVSAETREAERSLSGETLSALQPMPPPPRDLSAHRPAIRVSPDYVRKMVELVKQTAEAAHALHRKGAIHRDIKPGNIMVNPEGDTAVLMDLGLAQLADDMDGRLTRTRQFVGTLRYASPEQILSVGKLDARTDVYSLGATLFELLSLRPLYGATEETPTPELMERIQFQEPDRLHKTQPAVSKDLEAIVMKCLEKERPKRYGGANELADDLQRYLDGRPVKARPVGRLDRFRRWCRRKPAVAALSGLLLLAVLAGFITVTWKWVEADHALGNEQLALKNEKLAREAVDSSLKQVQEANEQAEQRGRDLQKTNTRLVQRESQLSDLNDNLGLINYNHALSIAYREWSSGNLGKWGTLLASCPPKHRGWDWDFVKGHGHGELFSFHQERSQWAVTFSKDGRWLAYGGEDNRITIRNAATLELVHILPRAKEDGHQRETRYLAFSPDGTRLASAGGDSTVKLWDIVTGQLKLTFSGHLNGVSNIAFSPDGQKLASIGSDNHLLLWDLNGKVELDLRCWSGGAFCGLAFDPTGTLLAMPSELNNAVSVVGLKNPFEGFVFRGHTKAIRALAFSPDGRYLASGSVDGKVKVWDMDIARIIGAQKENVLSSAAHVASFQHDHQISAVAFSPDGKRLATASWDQTVRLWNTTTWEEENRFRGHGNIILSLAFSADGSYLATASHEGVIKIWETDQPQDHRAELDSDARLYCTSVCYDRAGKQLIGSGRGGAHVWDTATNKIMATLSLADFWDCASVSSDGESLVMCEGYPGSNEHRMTTGLALWDLRTRTLTRMLAGHTDWVTSVAFRPGSAAPGQFASSSRDQTVLIWDRSQERPIKKLLHPDSSEDSAKKKVNCAVWALAYSADGKYLATGSEDRKLRIWNAEEGKLLHVRDGHTQPIRCLAFSSDGAHIVSGAGDNINKGEMIVWDAKTFRPLHRFTNLSGSIMSVAFHPQGKLVAAASYPRSVLICDARSGAELFALRSSINEAVSSVAWDPTGQHLACASGKIVIWSADRIAEVLTLRGHTAGVNSVASNPDGSKLASASIDATIQIWDAATGQPDGPPVEPHRDYYSRTLAWSRPDGALLAYDIKKGIRLRNMTERSKFRDIELELDDKEYVHFLVFNRGGTKLAAATSKHKVFLFDTATWSKRLLEGQFDSALSLAFSPGGKALASGGRDRNVRIWDVDSGKLTCTLMGHSDSVQEVAFLDDGRIASASKDRTLRVWDLASGAALTLRGHMAPVWSVVYHPEERKLFSCDDTGLCKVWDADTGTELATLRGHAGSVGFLHYIPATKLIASVGTDATIRLWDLDRLKGAGAQLREAQRWQRWSGRKTQDAARTVRLAKVIQPGQVYDLINLNTGNQALDWPSPDIQKLAGANAWNGWRPALGDVGEIIAVCKHPSNASTRVYILKIGKHYAPMDESGIEVLQVGKVAGGTVRSDAFARAQEIVLDSLGWADHSGRIAAAAEEHYYRFRARRNGWMTVSVSAAADSRLDANVDAFTPSRQTLVPMPLPRIYFPVTAGKEYLIKVNATPNPGQGREKTGFYRLTLSNEQELLDDFGNDFDKAYPLPRADSLGVTSIHGQIETENDADVFSFTAEATGKVSVFLFAGQAGLEGHVFVYDSTQRLLGDQGRVSNQPAVVDISAQAGATYFVKVTPRANAPAESRIGSYALLVVFPAPRTTPPK